MRPIEAIRGTTADSAGGFPRRYLARTRDGDAEVDGSRALIAIAPDARSEIPPVFSSGRPSAGFLAQLIATTQYAPQTRARRRAEQDVAIRRYRTAEAHSTTVAGRKLACSC